MFRVDRSFGPWTIPKEHIFYESELSFAFVNLRPACEGHVLISPKRVVQFFDLLTDAEKLDLLNTATHVRDTMKASMHTEGCAMTIQDGPAAGQTVPHVHFHVIPRNFPTKFSSSPDLSFETRCETSNKYRKFFGY
ncbi:HIT domain containing protein [Trichomonas vaginalis G3]|uniref:HIT domain containing protein n=1 Tax=Trichomonas vaginalis (strain ATCC PRA-98 / G3) TaxID=412133 RepID=A2E0S0_TRIV3|nr:bis(5'-adenosyl)-triphosphatase protein [Trichomonas vaginalis G3]EAY13815.1 HIT domain containing protein [Trichomonas vaginalis G3]KAI5542671.1 bis(5'-adenosyl)-triphosphatase protein [Trichomonas vaginalis G3]|eukprot:XP_001326038.1 HIT domain containing protein [Trichomonas vaginalis G3]